MRLKIKSTLGKGGFSVVYKATSTKFSQPVALKKIPKRRLEQEDLVRLVTNEVSIHKRCEHPNIVKFHDCFEDDEHINIVLELCEGGDCARLLRKRGRLPQHQVVSYLGQLLQAIEYLHRNQHFHRDIKLSNMLLKKVKSQKPDIKKCRVAACNRDGLEDEDDQDDQDDQDNQDDQEDQENEMVDDKCERYIVKLADFGLATQVGTDNGDEAHHTVCGTKLCMAPEVFWGRAQGPAADIFSVGVVAYTMLVGENPFQRRSDNDSFPLSTAMERVGYGKYTIPEFVSPEASDFVRRALCVDPAERPSASELLEHGLLTGVIGEYSREDVEEVEEEVEQEKKEVKEGQQDLILADAGTDTGTDAGTADAGTGADTNAVIDEATAVHPGVTELPSRNRAHTARREIEKNKYLLQKEKVVVGEMMQVCPPTKARDLQHQTTTPQSETEIEMVVPFTVLPLSTKRLSPTSISMDARLQQKRQPRRHGDHISSSSSKGAKEADISTLEIVAGTGEVMYHDNVSRTRMRVSADGLWVSIKIGGEGEEDEARGLQWWRYPLRDLPVEHRDLYRYVSEAVRCIRSLTPKLIVRDSSDSVVCTLMENDPLPLFEARYADGGCVRMSLACGLARIRVPLEIISLDFDENNNSGDHPLFPFLNEEKSSVNDIQGGGVWYGVQLTEEVQQTIISLHQNGETAAGSETVLQPLHSIDVDDSWCPNPKPPPRWDSTTTSNAVEPGHSHLLPVDGGGGGGDGCTSVTSYVRNLLSQSQTALSYCVRLSRKYEAECAACTCVDGTHIADPFPVTLVRSVFRSANDNTNDNANDNANVSTTDDSVHQPSSTKFSPLSSSSSAASFSSPFIRIKMTHADGTSSLSVPLSSTPVEGEGKSVSVGREQQQQNRSMEPPLQPVRLEGVGWVGRTQKGDLWIHCEDGVQMTLSSGGEELYYADVCIGEPRIYQVNATLPPHVKKRLPFVSKAMSSLRKNKVRSIVEL